MEKSEAYEEDPNFTDVEASNKTWPGFVFLLQLFFLLR
jgi:hypothetical protein